MGLPTIPKKLLRADTRGYGGSSRSTSVPAYLIEVAAKVVVSSDLEPEDLMANIYSRIAEFIPSDEDIVDIELNAFPLPDWHGAGSSDFGDGADSEEGGETSIP